jgi:hypothetical protein
MKTPEWWKAPDEGDEYHTPRVWEKIAVAAEKAGDTARAEYARQAAEAETRNMGGDL